jgi:hypothetical protein
VSGAGTGTGTGTGGTITVDPRFCGPPDTGNGGYVAGLLAAWLGGSGEITLRRPPPLGVPLAVRADGAGLVSLHDGDAVVATGTAAGSPDLDLPGPLSARDASAAAARCRLRLRPAEHPFPGCFVCGTARPDGLGILVGPVDGRDLAADVWSPDPALAGPDGAVRSEFVWAALDCPGGVGAIGDGLAAASPWVLGRFAATQNAPVRPGQPHVVLGWRIEHEGRKLLAGSAVLAPDGTVAAYARATWIQLR